MKKYSLALIFIFLFSSIAWAIPTMPTIPATPTINQPGTTYNVDKDIGDNGRSKAQAENPGTPWDTIAYGLSQIVAGDKLIIGEGATAYNEGSLTISFAGDTDTWTVIEGDTGDRPARPCPAETVTVTVDPSRVIESVGLMLYPVTRQA